MSETDMYEDETPNSLGRMVQRGLWRAVKVVAFFLFVAFGTLVLDTLPKLDRDLSGPIGADSFALTVLDRHGEEIASRGGRYAPIVPLSELPPYLPQAVLATEDKRFYHHFGFDMLGIGRALWTNLRAGAIQQGGSTITQQLAKNLYLGPQRTFWRKAQEALITVWLETKYTKDEILTLYLNRIYMGGGSYGVEAASRYYFDKSAREVTLAEAALLAGLIKAPTRFAPTNNISRAHARADHVLKRLVENGDLTQGDVFAARATPATIVEREPREGSQYFVDWIAGEILTFLPDRKGQLIVETTLDPVAQAQAEAAIRDALAEARESESQVGQGALVSMDPNGAVRAMVGGRDYFESQFNRSTQAERQPGSAFKIFVFLAALENGKTPESRVNDAPIYVDGWRPTNAAGFYRGRVTLIDAMRYSINTVAVRLSEEVGRSTVTDTAYRLGIRSPLAVHPSVALGTEEVTLVDLTSSYAVLASGGYRARPHGILRVMTPDGHVLYQHPGIETRIVAPGAARSMTYLLHQVILTGTGTRATIGGRPAAGKTGTSQENRDAWFIGYTGDQVTGVWFGNDDASPMENVEGGTLAAETWSRFMTATRDETQVVDLPGARPAPTVRRRQTETASAVATARPPSELHLFYAQLNTLFRSTLADARRPAAVFRQGGRNIEVR